MVESIGMIPLDFECNLLQASTIISELPLLTNLLPLIIYEVLFLLLENGIFRVD